MKAKNDPCLSCKLPDCDETDSNCPLNIDTSYKKWYRKLKNDPVRFAEYQTKKKELKRKWLQTSKGKQLWNKQIRNYRKKNPEIVKAIEERYREKVKRRLRDGETPDGTTSTRDEPYNNSDEKSS